MARRAGNDDVEDILQDAFLKVIEVSRRQDIEKLDHLLARVVRCLTIDRIRRRRTRSAAPGQEIREALDLTTDPELVAISGQRLRRTMAAIDDMPPRRREVFLLHRIDELPYSQIARRLNISMKAVEKHIHLALVELAEVDD